MAFSGISRERFLGILGVLAVTGGCAGDGCSCMAPLPNGFPATERHANSAQVRLTDSGLDFLSANIGMLANELVPGGLDFVVPASCGGDTEICCDVPPDYCHVVVDLTAQPGDPPRMELTPQDPPGNRLDVLLRARVYTSPHPLPVGIDMLLYTAHCDINVDTTDSGTPSITLRTSMDFNQDPTAGTTRIDTGDVTVGDLDNGDIDISGGFDCTIMDWFKGLFIGSLTDSLEQQISDMVREQLCKSCEVSENCAPFATCNAGTCEINDAAGVRCLQELGMTGRLFASELMSSISPGMQGSADLYLVAGGHGRTNNAGVSLGVLGGALPGDGVHDPCVPVAPQPAPPGGGIPESTTLQGNTRPDGQTYHVGIGVHQFYLNQLAWAFYDAGFLCLNVGTSMVDMLHSGTLSVLASSWNDLLHGETGPLIMAIRPTQPPTITLGEGTFDETGAIVDPLLTVVMTGLEIDFYGWVDQTYSRLFTLRSDVTVPISLDVNETGQLVPVLGDLEEAFQNLQVSNSELLDPETDSPENLATKFPAILSLAVGFLGDALGGFDLPQFAGLAIMVPEGGITSVDGKTVMAIFANLAVAPPAPKPTRAETTVEVLSVRVPPTAAFEAPALDRSLRPSVELALGGRAPDGGRDLEWQLRLDGGMWSPWRRTANLTLSREELWLQARHRLEVRSRQIGDPGTVDPDPAAVDVLIDTLAPQVTLSPLDEGILVRARDHVSPGDRLAVSYRFDDTSDWQAAGTAPVTIPIGLRDPAALEVQVADEAGNVTITGGESLSFHGRLPPDPDGGCACSVDRRQAGGDGAVILAILAVVGFAASRRRRAIWRAGLAILAVVASGLAPGCTCGGVVTSGVDAGSGPPDAETMVVPGPTGRWSDVAASGGRVVVSAYEQKFGDLVVGEVAGDAITFTAIDGVPDGPVVLDPLGYRGGIKAAGEDVGAWTSIALFQGNARISYMDIDRGILKMAVEAGGAWTTHIVDDNKTAGTVGMYTSLVLDQSGVPAIAYMAHALDDGMGGRTAELRWIQAITANPASQGDWGSPETVLAIQIPCTGLCGGAMACLAATSTCVTPEETCGECGQDQACVAGACADTIPTPPAVDLPEGVGLFTSAAYLPDGRPVIAWYDRINGDLKLSVRQDGAWLSYDLDVGYGDTGQFASLAVAPDGTVWVAYQDAIVVRLLVVSWKDGVTGPIEVVDQGLRDGDRPHIVAWNNALVVDGAGNLAVAYQDSTTADLLYARRDAAGNWTRGDLRVGPHGYGYYARAAVDGSTIYVSNYLYDRPKYPPGKLEVITLP